jgi:integrase
VSLQPREWGDIWLPTRSFSVGVDVKTVSAILGHSNAAMTLNVYADALADSKKVSMDLMGRIMSVGLS